jgi:hypothetical protein
MKATADKARRNIRRATASFQFGMSTFDDPPLLLPFKLARRPLDVNTNSEHFESNPSQHEFCVLFARFCALFEGEFGCSAH